MQLELGVAGCPFEYDFKIWGDLATESWVKSLWERIWHFDLSLEVDYKPLDMPRERDECIMERLVKDGVRGKRLVGINRARKAQEALFLSDIATANGRRIENTHVRHWKNSFKGTLGRHHSTLEYGLEFSFWSDRHLL